jgi:hypothetical protein
MEVRLQWDKKFSEEVSTMPRGKTARALHGESNNERFKSILN